MKLLSIDPSSTAPGFALFKNEEPQWSLTYELKSKEFLERIEQLILLLISIISEYKPDFIAIESPYLGISRSTSMKMGEIFGVVIAVCIMEGYNRQTIIEIHPMTAKKAAGVASFKNRAEGKEDVIQSMKKMFPDINIVDDNSADALAVGLAGIQKIKELI